MTMLGKLVIIVALAMTMELAKAANYIVGTPNGGWDLMTPLQAWANSQTFVAGDTITFAYAPNHNVVEVSKPDYDACLANNSIQSYSGGNTVISLTSSGNRYFICGIPGHCDRGMKIVITTLAAPTPPQATPSIPPSATPLTPVPATPSGTPKASPVASPPPKTTEHSPTHAPKASPSAAPSKYPTSSPSKAPAMSSASSPTAPTTESPAIPPFPGASSPSSQPSAANRINVIAGFTMGFGFIIVRLLTL